MPGWAPSFRSSRSRWRSARSRWPSRSAGRGWHTRWARPSCQRKPLLLLLPLAEDERVGVALKVVGQHAQRSRGPRDLLEGIAQLLLGRGVLAHEGRVGVLEHGVGADESGAQIRERRAELGHELAVEPAQELVRARERLVEGDERFADVGTDGLKWKLVQLGENVGDLRLEVRQDAG